jgi:hypothetical protein
MKRVFIDLRTIIEGVTTKMATIPVATIKIAIIKTVTMAGQAVKMRANLDPQFGITM